MSSVVRSDQVSPRRRAIEELNAALNTVTVNAQAIAAADLVMGSLATCRDQFSSWSIDSSRRWAADNLDEAITDVRRYRAELKGMPQEPVAGPTWYELRHAIQRAYGVMWAIQDVQGTETEWQALLGFVSDVATGSVQAMPGIIRDALKFTTTVVTDTVGATAAGLLPLWPLVVVGGLVLVLGAVALAAAKKKGIA